MRLGNIMWVRIRVQGKVPAGLLSVCFMCVWACPVGLMDCPACRTNKLIFYWITNNKRKHKRKKSIKKTAHKNLWPRGKGDTQGGGKEMRWDRVHTSVWQRHTYIHIAYLCGSDSQSQIENYISPKAAPNALYHSHSIPQLTPHSHLSFPPLPRTAPSISVCAFIESIGHLRLLLI